MPTLPLLCFGRQCETGETIRSEEEHQGVVATTGEPPAIEGGKCSRQLSLVTIRARNFAGKPVVCELRAVDHLNQTIKCGPVARDRHIQIQQARHSLHSFVEAFPGSRREISAWATASSLTPAKVPSA